MTAAVDQVRFRMFVEDEGELPEVAERFRAHGLNVDGGQDQRRHSDRRGVFVLTGTVPANDASTTYERLLDLPNVVEVATLTLGGESLLRDAPPPFGNGPHQDHLVRAESGFAARVGAWISEALQ